MKAVVAAFNQEKALVGAFSVITNFRMKLFEALVLTLALRSCTQYWMFLVLTSGFGLATGVWVACETPLIIRTLSFSCLTPAFGLLTAGGGLAALTGAPLAGWVMDESSTASGLAVVSTE